MPVDHYQTLGVTPDADITQIKRRYRQLVRQNHPDALPVAQRAAAHNQMLAINLAWTTLSDPASRAQYDRKQSAAPGFFIHPPQSSTINVPATSTRNASSPNPQSSARATQSATAQSSTARAATTARPAKTASKAGQRRGDTRSRLLTQVFEAAELYFFYGKVGEAIGLCRRVLDQDSNNAEAHALLGDIYADQGRFADAVFMFERAVQSQPQNTLYRQKWEALSGKVTGFSPSDFQTPRYSANGFPHADFVEHDANEAERSQRGQRTTSTRNQAEAPHSTTARVVCGIALMVLSFFFALSGHLAAPGLTFSWAPAAPIAGRLLLSATLSALVLGAALPLLGQIEPFGAVSQRHSPTEGTPTLLLVGLAGIAFAPLSWAFALLLSFSTGRANKPLFRYLSIGILLSATLALPARNAVFVPTLNNALLWWSGRALFPALLAGWALGSLGARDR